jgi:hypothetical protein
MGLKKICGFCGLNASVSGQGPVASSCEHGDETSVSIGKGAGLLIR